MEIRADVLLIALTVHEITLPPIGYLSVVISEPLWLSGHFLFSELFLQKWPL